MALIGVIGAIKLEPSVVKLEPTPVVEIYPDDVFKSFDEDSDEDKRKYISESKTSVDVAKDEDVRRVNDFCGTENLRENERLVINFNKQVEPAINYDKQLRNINSGKVDWANVYKTREETYCLEEQRKVKKVYGSSWNKPIPQEDYTCLSSTSFICNYCHREITSKKSLFKHIRTLHQETSVIHHCPYCPKQSKWGLRYHILAEHKDESEINWFQCYDCNKKFRRKELLSKHIQTHLGNVEKSLTTCPNCERVFNSRRGMLDHARKVHERKYQCEKCSYTAKSFSQLRYHIQVRHTDPSDLPTYQCSKCNFKTSHRHYYYEHCNKHERKYMCEKCAFTTNSYQSLKLHENTHKEKLDDETLKYRCEKCDYKTYRMYSLQVHKLTHLKPGEINYFRCYHCKFKANRKDNLKAHILRHFKKEEVALHCFICDFNTKKRDALTNHINQHKNRLKLKKNSAF